MDDVDGKNIGSGSRSGSLRRGLSPEAKVAVAIYTLLALLTVSVLLAVVMIVGVKEHSTQLIDRQPQYAAAIDEVALHAKAMANDERGFLISGRRSSSSSARSGRRGAGPFAMALSQASGAAERAAVERARAGFERWVAELRSSSSVPGRRSGRRGYGVTRPDAFSQEGVRVVARGRGRTRSRWHRGGEEFRDRDVVPILDVPARVPRGRARIGFGIALWILSSRSDTRRQT